GGEKYSYQVPTYEALKGILSSVYWKPTIVWVIDKVRVMKPIRTQPRSTKPVHYGGIYPSLKNPTKKEEPFNDLSIYTYLADVEYQVQAHFEWNENRPDLVHDRNENKHYYVARRMIERGGRRDVFLGTRECQGYVEPCEFGEGEGFYDNYPGEMSFGLMFHGFDYPDENKPGDFWARFWAPKMDKGLIPFIHPKECKVRKFVRPMKARPPDSIGLAEEGLLEGYGQGGV
ncbi:MAG: type I-C CRISPR-associated protein Cas5, partial [Deltaproteobacteria bacterium]|nr:type I-C CRISPR-associated protein Cas5 [Deltaproteobacteria bacterium]